MLTIPWVLLAASAAAASAAASGLDLKNDQQLVPPGPPERGVGAAPGVGRTTAGVHVWGEEDVASGAEARSAAEEPDSSTRESDRSPTRRLLDRSRQLASTRTPLGRSRRLLGFTGLGKKITKAVTTVGDAVVDTVNTVGAAVNTLKDAKINCDIGEYVSKKMNTGFVNCDSGNILTWEDTLLLGVNCARVDTPHIYSIKNDDVLSVTQGRSPKM